MTDLFTQSNTLARIQPPLTVNTSAYASGNLISKAGTVLTLANAVEMASRGGVIQSVGLVDLNKQNAPIDVVFFRENPVNTTFTDSAAFAIADADMSKVIGFASIINYASFSDNSFGYLGNLAMDFALNGGTSLFAALVSRGTPTYASAADLVLTVGILRI